MLDACHYQIHLDRVSRSFAFCIARLEGEFRGWVGLSYLLCRILDTVEDAPWASAEERDAADCDFEACLAAAPDEQKVKSWAARFPAVPEGERALLLDSS